MYASRIAEIGKVRRCGAQPAPILTPRGLMAAIPTLDEAGVSRLAQIPGARCRASRPSRRAAPSTRAARTHSTVAAASGPRHCPSASGSPRAGSMTARSEGMDSIRGRVNRRPLRVLFLLRYAGEAASGELGADECVGAQWNLIRPLAGASESHTVSSSIHWPEGKTARPHPRAAAARARRAAKRVFDVSKPWISRMVEREPRRLLKAVDGLDFTIRRGETLPASSGDVGIPAPNRPWPVRWSACLRPGDGQVTIDGIDVAATADPGGAARRSPAPHADDFPRPLRLAQPALAGGRHHRRTDPCLRARPQDR